MVTTGKGRNQHHEGALRQMEIGDQTIHGLEAIAGIDKDLRPLGLCFKSTIVVYKRFQRAAGGRAHADYPSAGTLCFVQDGSSFGAHHAQLRVHMMLQNNLCLHGAECAKANVQGHKGRLYAFGSRLFQQFLGPVQTCCGRGS